MSKTLFVLLLIYRFLYSLPFQQFTGTWVKGAALPMEFVTTPDYYVFDKKLIIYIHNVKSGALPIVYIYFCDSDEWYRVPIEINHELRLDIRELSETMPIKFKTASCYIGKY